MTRVRRDGPRGAPCRTSRRTGERGRGPSPASGRPATAGRGATGRSARPARRRDGSSSSSLSEGGNGGLLADDLDEHPLVASAVELAVEDLLPRAEVEPALRHG